MTKELTAEEKRLNHNIEYILFDYMEFEYAKECSEKIMQWHKQECKRFALECVSKQKTESTARTESAEQIIAWNGCREIMIKNIEDKSK